MNMLINGSKKLGSCRSMSEGYVVKMSDAGSDFYNGCYIAVSQTIKRPIGP